jgi:serine/threonine protein kinase
LKKKKSPIPIPYDSQSRAFSEFCKTGYQQFTSREKGLKAFKWKELSLKHRPVIAGGAYSKIRMAYRADEEGVPLESRHLAVCKVMDMRDKELIWKEVTILSGLNHENIIGMYEYFAVDKRPESRTDSGSDVDEDDAYVHSFWILLELATAGSLFKELRRYVRYYHLISIVFSLLCFSGAGTSTP